MASRTRVFVRGLGISLCTAAMLGPMAAHAAATDLYYERTVMTAADQRCRLFDPGIGLALAAGQAQARGAALRAGVAREQLNQIETRARNKAGAQACTSPDLRTAAGRVKEGFAGWARLLKMTYPGDVAGWTAERPVSKTNMVWNLSQSARFGADQLTFGLATGKDGTRNLIAVVRFADGARPYAARIVMRDLDRAAQPYLDKRRAVGGTLPLSARVAPRVATDAYMAEARFAPDAFLVPASMKGAIAYQFPAAATRALADLDPREAVEVEFLFSAAGGDTVRKAYLEVGDFAAGRAFLASAQR